MQPCAAYRIAWHAPHTSSFALGQKRVGSTCTYNGAGYAGCLALTFFTEAMTAASAMMGTGDANACKQHQIAVSRHLGRCLHARLEKAALVPQVVRLCRTLCRASLSPCASHAMGVDTRLAP